MLESVKTPVGAYKSVHTDSVHDSPFFEVQQVLINLLERFGLIFDKWDNGSSVNYLEIFVIWWDEKLAANRVYLPRMCPFVRVPAFGPASHLE